MKKLLIVYVILSAVASAGSILSAKSKEIYKDPKAPVEKRVKDLLSRMTLEEKIWQITQGVYGGYDNPNNILGVNRNTVPYIGSVICHATSAQMTNLLQKKAVDSTRLGIPILVGMDIIHGNRTVYPIPLAQGASFNPNLAYQASRVAARESYDVGIHWTFSPMIDITHDPRWGRVMEAYGEDPYVNARFCEAAVKGYQGENLSDEGSIAACLKHYVGYGESEGGRDYFPTDISNQMLWDTYFPPYEAGVKAGAATVMSSFNTLNGIPATCNPYTLQEVLRGKWGFEGFVVSDWEAVMQIVLQGCAADKKEAGEKAINSGLDMDMADFVYVDFLKELIEEGKVSEKTVDEAVSRVLTLKFRLGLFENPYRPETSEADFLKPEYRAVAEQMAAESAVLLKNEAVLPLKKDAKVAVIGPIAEDQKCVMGNWRGLGEFADVITLLDGMKAEFPNLTYSKGCEIEGNDKSGFADAVAVAQASDVVVLCLGEGFLYTGENCSRGSISLPGVQEELFAELVKTGKPVVVLIESGRPLDLTRIAPGATALMDIWCPGVNGGPAVASLLSGRRNPSGKLPVTFPYTLKQIPVYYNHRDRSRRGNMGIYNDGTPLEPLFDFGYGLSYSKFEYSDIQADGLHASVKVTNTSAIDGEETVLWFIKDMACSIARPVKELKYFEKRLIKAGQTEVFEFEMDKLRDLGFVDSRGDRFFEPGQFIIFTGDKQKTIEVK